MSNNGRTTKRKDKNRIVLRKGESQRENGTYDYRWTDENGKRHTVYAKTLDELRLKEDKISKNQLDGIHPYGENMTVDDLYKRWIKIKIGIRDVTKTCYVGAYKTTIFPYFGDKKISKIHRSDVMLLYKTLLEERGLAIGTISGTNRILLQMFQLAVDDRLLSVNPVTGSFKEFKRINNTSNIKKTGLSMAEQEAWLNYLKIIPRYQYLYAIVAVLVGTGLRISELAGLRWCDIDFDNGYIDVNHNLIYYSHTNGRERSYKFAINPTKTKTSIRKIEMLDFVSEALLSEKERQNSLGLKCLVTIDGYSDFVFINKNGNVRSGNNIGIAIHRSIAKFNRDEKKRHGDEAFLLPDISCHALRHTFTNRMCEAGVDIKLMQDVLGHSTAATTLDIYADVTDDLRDKNLTTLQDYYNLRQKNTLIHPSYAKTYAKRNI